MVNQFIEIGTVGIPEAAEVAVPVAHFPANQTASEEAETGAGAATPISGVPNSSPLNLFPQETVTGGGSGGRLGPLDFLRNSQQVRRINLLTLAVSTSFEWSKGTLLGILWLRKSDCLEGDFLVIVLSS
ncbi:hypothetical protein U1Q18_037209 [Sarracenia purpurea var. burkii]